MCRKAGNTANQAGIFVFILSSKSQKFPDVQPPIFQERRESLRLMAPQWLLVSLGLKAVLLVVVTRHW